MTRLYLLAGAPGREAVPSSAPQLGCRRQWLATGDVNSGHLAEVPSARSLLLERRYSLALVLSVSWAETRGQRLPLVTFCSLILASVVGSGLQQR